MRREFVISSSMTILTCINLLMIRRNVDGSYKASCVTDKA